MDFSVEYSYSNYHKYTYWDAESRRIHQDLCHWNNIKKTEVPIVSAEKPAVSNDGIEYRILAFPAQIEAQGFSNSSHTDIHLAAEFISFLYELKEKKFNITIKTKDEGDQRYFPGFSCICRGRGNYMELVKDYTHFISCGFTTPGIDLRVRGFNSYYFYPVDMERRLYGFMTVSSADEFISVIHKN